VSPYLKKLKTEKRKGRRKRKGESIQNNPEKRGEEGCGAIGQ
jgi:hypothetical protein